MFGISLFYWFCLLPPLHSFVIALSPTSPPTWNDDEWDKDGWGDGGGGLVRLLYTCLSCAGDV